MALLWSCFPISIKLSEPALAKTTATESVNGHFSFSLPIILIVINQSYSDHHRGAKRTTNVLDKNRVAKNSIDVDDDLNCNVTNNDIM